MEEGILILLYSTWPFLLLLVLMVIVVVLLFIVNVIFTIGSSPLCLLLLAIVSFVGWIVIGHGVFVVTAIVLVIVSAIEYRWPS